MGLSTSITQPLPALRCIPARHLAEREKAAPTIRMHLATTPCIPRPASPMRALLFRLLRWLLTIPTSWRKMERVFRPMMPLPSIARRWLGPSRSDGIWYPSWSGSTEELFNSQLLFRPVKEVKDTPSRMDMCASRVPDHSPCGEAGFPTILSQSTGCSSSAPGLHSASVRSSFLHQDTSLQHLDDTQREHFHLRSISAPNLRAHACRPSPSTSSCRSRRTASPNPNRLSVAFLAAFNVGGRHANVQRTLTNGPQNDARSPVDQTNPLQMRRHNGASAIYDIGRSGSDPGGYLSREVDLAIANDTSRDLSLHELPGPSIIHLMSPGPGPPSLTTAVDPALLVSA